MYYVTVYILFGDFSGYGSLRIVTGTPGKKSGVRMENSVLQEPSGTWQNTPAKVGGKCPPEKNRTGKASDNASRT